LREDFFFGVPGLIGANGDPVLLIIRGELVGDKCGLLLGLAVEYTTPTK
jgi:hypothetical protein